MIVAGIDYSLTSPSICIYKETNGNNRPITCDCPNNCTYYFFDTNAKWTSSSNMNAFVYPEYKTDIERYQKLAQWSIDRLIWYTGRVDRVVIEDYAYAATGRVFNIAENGAILKYYLTENKIKYVTVPPTTIKKFATGKGNASKDMMYESWRLAGGTEFDKPNKNPYSDIVDSYFLCKYGIETYNSENISES